jgi:hypothetical protein
MSYESPEYMDIPQEFEIAAGLFINDVVNQKIGPDFGNENIDLILPFGSFAFHRMRSWPIVSRTKSDIDILFLLKEDTPPPINYISEAKNHASDLILPDNQGFCVGGSAPLPVQIPFSKIECRIVTPGLVNYCFDNILELLTKLKTIPKNEVFRGYPAISAKLFEMSWIHKAFISPATPIQGSIPNNIRKKAGKISYETDQFERRVFR